MVRWESVAVVESDCPQQISRDDGQLRASSVRYYHHHHHHHHHNRQQQPQHSQHRDSPNNKAQQFGITWKLHSILAEREPKANPTHRITYHSIRTEPANRTRIRRWAGPLVSHHLIRCRVNKVLNGLPLCCCQGVGPRGLGGCTTQREKTTWNILKLQVPIQNEVTIDKPCLDNVSNILNISP